MVDEQPRDENLSIVISACTVSKSYPSFRLCSFLRQTEVKRLVRVSTTTPWKSTKFRRYLFYVIYRVHGLKSGRGSSIELVHFTHLRTSLWVALR